MQVILQSLPNLEPVLLVAGVRHREHTRPGRRRLGDVARLRAAAISADRSRAPRLGVALAVACALGVAAAAVPAPTSASDAYAALLAPRGACAGDASLHLDPASARSAMLCLVNYARTRSGLAPLRLRETLNLAGQAKLQADLSCDEFSHSPCGRSFRSVFAGYLAGASSYRIGENLAWGTGDDGTPRQTLNSWLHSPEHRANLLAPQFRDLGIGYLPNERFRGVRGATLWSQEFGAGGQAQT